MELGMANAAWLMARGYAQAGGSPSPDLAIPHPSQLKEELCTMHKLRIAWNLQAIQRAYFTL